LLTKCPYIALSATIGTPDIFHKWLQTLETHRSSLTKNKRREVRFIKYEKRFSDLKRFIYTKDGLKSIHPVSCLNIPNIKKHGKIPDDINLTAEEIIKLCKALQEVFGNDFLSLNPETSKLLQHKLSSSLFLTRDGIYNFGKYVLSILLNLILSQEECKIENLIEKLKISDDSSSYNDIDDDELKKLVENLNNNDMMPCIFFTNHRVLCEQKANMLTDYLKTKNLRLSNNNKLDNEINKYVERYKYKEFFEMFDYGVAYHHSSVSADLKSIVEALFRLGKIKVIFATATLSLGINMPCKTVVFMDDNIFLDSFQYRQASGRAGRRGFDFNGNVVFFDIPKSKVERLVGSFIPDLRPQFPISVSVIMQLYHFLKLTPKYEASFDFFLDKSYWKFMYPSKGIQIRYDAFFSINFLMNLQLIYETGEVSSLSQLLERIHYHEPSSYLFYYLLMKNVFHDICSNAFIKKGSKIMKTEEIYKKVMLVMCHLFNRVYVLNEKEENLLPSLPLEIAKSIESYNSLVYQHYTAFFTNLTKKLIQKNPIINFLPVSKINFETKMSSSLKPFFDNLIYDAYLTSPFGALSGLQDNNLLETDKSLYLNITSNLNVDSKILPLYQSNANLCNYALLIVMSDNIDKTVKIITENRRMLVGDLYNYLNDFSKVFNSISITFKKLAPRTDPVRLVFNELNVKIRDRFIEVSKYLSKNYK
jgi:hypothetical protein